MTEEKKNNGEEQEKDDFESDSEIVDSDFLIKYQQREIYDYLKKHDVKISVFGHEENKNPEEFEYGVNLDVPDFALSESFLLGLSSILNFMEMRFSLQYIKNIGTLLIIHK